jgi:hypothetical protein
MATPRFTSASPAFTHRYRRLAPQTGLHPILVSDFFRPCPVEPANTGVSKLNSAFSAREKASARKSGAAGFNAALSLS